MASLDKPTHVLLVGNWSLLACWGNCAEAAGLPECPPELTILDYLGIWFKTKCSSCGKRVKRRADPLLKIRLCIDCADNLLIETRLVEPQEIRELVLSSRDSTTVIVRRNARAMLSLKSEVEHVKRYLEEHSKDDLSVWRKGRIDLLEARRKEAQSIAAAVKASKDAWEAARKERYYEAVAQKLRELGCMKSDEEILPKLRDSWTRLTRRPIALTEKLWIALEPKIMAVLDSNNKAQLKIRSDLRASKLRELFDALRHPTPLPHDLSAQSKEFIDRTLEDWMPSPRFPDMRDILIFQDLLNTDRTVEQMEARFMDFRAHITEKILEWSRNVKTGLIEIASRGRKSVDASRTLLFVSNARGTRVAPSHGHSSESRVLLLPDSFFRIKTKNGFITRSYADLALATSRGKSICIGKLDMADFAWDPEASAMARKLLATKHRWNGHMNLALDTLECRLCGRSNMPWSSLVTHYVQQYAHWSNIQPRLPDIESSGYVFLHDHNLDLPPAKLKIPVDVVQWSNVEVGKRVDDARGVATKCPTHRYVCRICDMAKVKDIWVYDLEDMQVHLKA
ncbi:hypothetical protein RhiJN_19755 [Ceratobasidium sp. AG-Ba]|nr:hypothetical protein RhiJN_04925 [Ceratobasidium sp. AG-Ba]QRV91737.1 hypothetical protein RhiJN_19755 [Ceratobasidium sp. AG-Ba]